MNFIQKLCLIICSSALFAGCARETENYNTFIIWTDREEIVSYCELFNSMQDKVKATIVYKDRLATSLPPAKDEEKPDLIVGSWLKNDATRKNFRIIDSLLSRDCVDTSTIYPSLIEYGKAAGKQYLLPVSFNLPLVIFSAKNASRVTEKYALTLDQIKEAASQFNAVNKDGVYTKMGFGPSWDSDFLYEVTKQFGPCFKEKGTSFTWNEERLKNAVNYIKAWTAEKNTSTASEQDFEFKYLYTPKYRHIAFDRTLFAYTVSSEIFKISSGQLEEIDYRWLKVKDGLPADDKIVSMAVYAKSKNPERAEQFIKWFFKEENQRLMLERTQKMQLDTATFGIASGFSSIIDVNEHIFPTYYRNLLGNLPDAKSVTAPQGFPGRWESLKDRVIYPYLTGAVNTDSSHRRESMTQLLNAWSKQFD